MTAGAVLGCYALAWLFTARLLYGRWRGKEVGCRACSHHGTPSQRRYRPGLDCCYDETAQADGVDAAFAMAAALFWPMVILAAAVRFRPPPTAAERAAAEKKLKARIAELEREGGITRT